MIGRMASEPQAGQELEGRDGFRLRFVRTAAETGGELLEMEASYAGGDLPPEHWHPSQHENFEVLEGAVKTIVDGVDRRYETGERFEVPAGVRHQMTGDGPARVRWEVRPALRTAEFFARLHGGEALDRAFFDEFRDEIRLTLLEES
jgi:quercetin dioxygenase-like cupin family protein